MAITDGAVVLPGRGYIFVNDTPGAVFPATTQAEVDALDLDAATIATDWVNLGHTSRENAVALNRDGEEGETKGTWQRPSFRKTAATNEWSFSVNALQVDNNVLDLYFGAGDISDPDAFHVPFTSVPEERALYLVLVDGTARLGWGVAKVAIEADEAPEFDPENFLEFSLKMTVLEESGAQGLMSLYKLGLGTPAP